jgi:hypothetical protein
MVTKADERSIWTKAAQRALAADLPHRLRRRAAAVLVPSCAGGGRVYRVLLDGGRVGRCDCPAGAAGNPCKHVAAVALRLWERETAVRLVEVKAVEVAVLDRYLRPAARPAQVRVVACPALRAA